MKLASVLPWRKRLSGETALGYQQQRNQPADMDTRDRKRRGRLISSHWAIKMRARGLLTSQTNHGSHSSLWSSPNTQSHDSWPTLKFWTNWADCQKKSNYLINSDTLCEDGQKWWILPHLRSNIITTVFAKIQKWLYSFILVFLLPIYLTISEAGYASSKKQKDKLVADRSSCRTFGNNSSWEVY